MGDYKRKEVWLHEKVINKLETLANLKQWSLKHYMESVLEKDSLKFNKIKSQPNTKTK